ncbi:hypothetical protein F4820DRAFT_364217 [Hypoxylon rubiginosum]|uniref:Uncharacterized protein n=1 Tax=Hypoxylon rubiginosum TaxID=110542 RepID=A0ACB9ZFD5_9PEZI|nr:hypothetical protein F4820DRAFT_364217 [Hypoxylon rubiginosum]
MYNQHKIVRRLLGRQNPDSPNDSNLGVTSSPVPQSYRPNASQDAVYPSTVPVACLDRSPDGQLAVLGGRHILKTIHFDGLRINEGVDIRSAITAQFANKTNPASLVSDQLSIKDVRFVSNHSGNLSVFTACANGKIFMYDISRLGVGLDFIQIRQDSRQINKLDSNPHKGTLLLSGSQDGTVRCFDVKAPIPSRTGPTFRQFQAFNCNSDGVSDVKWSPKDGFAFACATDSGIVLKWDIRKNNVPVMRINAHDTQKGASSISWHADGDHLISAGLDSKCYVWDLSGNAGKRQKPKWTINCPAPVTSVAWRPGLWSATAQGRRAAQVAVSYDEGGHIKKHGISSVHIWDLARPTMPYKEIDIFDNSPSAILWHDQDLLWTAGPGGFAQCDVAFAPKVIDRQSLSSLAFSARGEALIFLEERVQLPRPRPAIVAQHGLPTSSYSSSPTGQMLSISRSDSEEDVIGSFLGARRRTTEKRRATSRAAQTLSTTPPSGAGVEEKVIPLDQSMNITGPFKPQQIMAIGPIPAASNTHLYRYLSRQYLEILERELPYTEGAKPLHERISGIIEQYARASENVSQFRLAQTWRILAYAIGLLLSRRSQYHLEQRLNRRQKPQLNVENGVLDTRFETSPIFSKTDTSPRLKINGEDTPRKPASVTSLEGRHPHAKSLLAEEIDSESNVPTPLARPVNEEANDYIEHGGGRMLTPVLEMESFNLPPGVLPDGASPRRRLNSASLSTLSHDSHGSQKSSTEGYDFYDVDAAENIPRAIDVPRRRGPRNLEFVDSGSPSQHRKSIARHDSDESYAQIFSISDTSRQTSGLTESSSGSGRQLSRKLERNHSSPEEADGEYESRIRGKRIDESPESARYPIRQPIERHDSSLTEELQITQATTDTFDSDSPQQTDSRSLRYSGPGLILPKFTSGLSDKDQPENHLSPHITETDYLPWADDPPYPHPITAEVAGRMLIPPINPYDLLSRALAFESKQSALNASAIILLLKPLVPDDVIDSYQAAAILRQHHNRLMGMKLFVEAALLRNLCVHGWPDGLDLWGENYPSVFAPAQDRVSVGFMCSNCHKPREIDRSKTDGPGIWKCERCRAVMAPCAVCGHRDATADPPHTVPVVEGFAASASPRPASAEPILSTWWYCPGCSHGGHANCLQDWHAPVAPPSKEAFPPLPFSSPAFAVDGPFPETNSDGCCPLDGCGHACLPGRWRNETSAARTEELGRAVREQTRGSVSAGSGLGGLGLNKRTAAKDRKASSANSASASASATAATSAATAIRGDAIEVPQSRAVESVRETLSAAADVGTGTGGSVGSGGSSNGGGGLLAGILSSSPGRAAASVLAGGGGGPERRKSVKFAGPPGEGR